MREHEIAPTCCAWRSATTLPTRYTENDMAPSEARLRATDMGWSKRPERALQARPASRARASRVHARDAGHDWTSLAKWDKLSGRKLTMKWTNGYAKRQEQEAATKNTTTMLTPAELGEAAARYENQAKRDALNVTWVPSN